MQQNVPLAPLTTLGVGGAAQFFVRAESEFEVVEAFAHANENRLKVFVLGGGSNILVSDNGFPGLVIQIALQGVKLSDNVGSNFVTVTAQAGEDWDKLVSDCVKDELAGIECLSGIPGFVGGTPVQNVGAYGQEVSETIESVRCFDRTRNEIVELDNADCGFTYRKSIFNSVDRDRYVVMSVAYRLERGGEPKIVYKDLREHFRDTPSTLAGVRNAVLGIRRSKSMVIDKNDPNSRSAGSFFKNPIVDEKRLGAISAQAGPEVAPSFPAGEGRIKIPAAWLIEQSGFHKGYRSGNAGISTNHSLAIVNFGGASAAEIIELKDRIQAAVKKKFDILLEPEPVFVGFD